jgi:hypothetical protein
MQAEGLRRASWPGSPLDATALRRDISEAQAHIIGLQRRYRVEVCGHFNPFARPDNTIRAAPSPPRGGTIPLLNS